MAEEFKIGDNVKLGTSRIVMNVVGVTGGLITCAWIAKDGSAQRAEYPPASLSIHTAVKRDRKQFAAYR